MSYLKNGYDIIDDAILKEKKQKREVKNLIDHMISAIETDTIDEYFYSDYQKLNKLIVKVKWKERDKEYKEKYIRIREFHKKHQGIGAILI